MKFVPDVTEYFFQEIQRLGRVSTLFVMYLFETFFVKCSKPFRGAPF